MKIEATIDASVLRGRLRTLQDMRFVTQALDGVADDLASEVAMTFKNQADPWGMPWKPLRRSTIRARRQGKGTGSPQILRDTGRLQNSISSRRIGPLTVEIGTTTPYAAIHQFGGTIAFAARSLRVRLRQVKNDNGKLVTRFAKDKHKRATTKWGSSQGWSVNIPARPFLPIRDGGIVSLPVTWAAAIRRRLELAAVRAAEVSR